ncbi:MAG: hypothetical protein ABI399_04360 [Bauldia sp.]
MKVFKIASPDVIRLTGIAGVALSLAGCGSAMTYGTGTTPGVQTVEDIAGIVSLSGKKKDPIDYSPRAPIVAPPSTAALPPPGSRTYASAENWPKDPDELRRTMVKRQEDASRYGGTYEAPKFATPVSQGGGAAPQRKLTNAEIKKAFADARSNKAGSVDAEGRPVRKYLTEPPASYREPDPNSPVDVTEKPKKKKKSWWPF